MSNFQDRLLRAARLDVHLYEEVEADTEALSQAMAVVALASVAAGVGTFSLGGFGRVIMGTMAGLFSWFIWAYLVYLIGTKLLPEPQTHADPGQLLRAIGFASAPGLIRVLGIIPGLTKLVFFAASIWMLVAMVIAVRQALDYSNTLRAVVVCLIGWLVQGLIFMLLFSLWKGSPML